MLNHRWMLASLAILLTACAAPREPTQPGAAMPDAEKQETAPAPSVARGAGVYYADLVATEFATDQAAHGEARLWLSEDGAALHYEVSIGGLGPATSVHMHLTAAAGTRQTIRHSDQPLLSEDAHGPIVVTLMHFKHDGVAA